MVGSRGSGATENVGEERGELAFLDRRSAVERIDQHAVFLVADPHQDMARRIEGVNRPADPAAQPGIEDGERHRQAPPAVDDPDQIGIGGIVIAVAVAEKAMAAADHPGQDGRRRPGLDRAAGLAEKVEEDLAEPVAIIGEVQSGMVEGGNVERGDVELDRFVLEDSQMGDLLYHGLETSGGMGGSAASAFAAIIAVEGRLRCER